MADDRVLPATRWTAWAVVPVLAVGGLILYGLPGRTAQLWAWPISPEMTPLAMGGGYLAGALFFARGAHAGRWHAMAVGFVGASVLSWLLLLATVLHWDRFTHGHPAFLIWLVVYAVAPFLLPALWWRNRRHDPGPAGGDRLVPRWLRTIVGGAGGVQLVVAVGMFLRPDLAAQLWPWTLTPLTARSLSAFVAFVAVAAAAFLFEPRWSGLRLHVESAVLGLVLVALGAGRAAADLQPGLPTAVLAALLGGAILGLAALWAAMRRSPAAAGAPPR